MLATLNGWVAEFERQFDLHPGRTTKIGCDHVLMLAEHHQGTPEKRIRQALEAVNPHIRFVRKSETKHGVWVYVRFPEDEPRITPTNLSYQGWQPLWAWF